MWRIRKFSVQSGFKLMTTVMIDEVLTKLNHRDKVVLEIVEDGVLLLLPIRVNVVISFTFKKKRASGIPMLGIELYFNNVPTLIIV